MKLKCTQELLTCFKIPMSRQAYNEFLLLQNVITSLPPTSSHVNDVWCFIWGNQRYTALGSINIITPLYILLDQCYGSGSLNVFPR